MPLCPIGRPIHRLRQVSVCLDHLPAVTCDLIAFQTIAAKMSKLQVGKVRWMTTFGDGNDVVYRCRKRIWIRKAEINFAAADGTMRLRCVYSLLIPLKLRPVLAVLIGTVSVFTH